MNCDATRDQLEMYITGDLDQKSAGAVAEHLLTCTACAAEYEDLRLFLHDLRETGEAYRPIDMWIGGGAPAKRHARRRWLLPERAWQTAAAALLVFVVGAVTVASIPAVAQQIPLPFGNRLQKLVDEVRQLRSDNRQLQTALVTSLVDNGQAQAEIEAQSKIAGLQPPSATDELAQQTGIDTFVGKYFDARAQAELPGAAGARARASLAGFFLPGAHVVAQERYVALGHRALATAGGETLLAVGSLARIQSLEVSPSGVRARVVLNPVQEFYVGRATNGQITHTVPGGSGEGVYGHVLTLVGGPGHWKVEYHTHLNEAGIDLARSGGAPKWMLQVMRHRMNWYWSTQAPPTVPDGARATLDRLCELLNEHRFKSTGALFVDGIAYGGKDLNDTRFADFYVRSVTVIDPRRAIAADNPGYLLLDVAINAPEHLFRAGGPGFPRFFKMQQTATGEWQIVSINTAG
jgi:hypothetical protein